MPLNLYPVPVISAAQSREAMVRHCRRTRESFEYLADDIQAPISFAVSLTVDTLGTVILAMAKAANGKDTVLPSGWAYCRMNFGNDKVVDLMLLAPGDKSEGFVFRVHGDGPTVAESRELASVSAHVFTDRKYWYPSKKKQVLDALKAGSPRAVAIKHTSQQWHRASGQPLMTDGPDNPDPEGTLTVLPPLIEALQAFDPALFRDCAAARSTLPYHTLFEDRQDILIAARGAMSVDGNLPGPAFAKFVEAVWRTGMAEDIDARLRDIDGLAKMLTEENNVSKRTENDFDDDRCGAYVKADGETTTVFFRHEKEALAVTRGPDRLTVSAADYGKGEVLETWVDLTLEGGKVSAAREAAPFTSYVSSSLRYWSKMIEGFGEAMAEDAEPEIAIAAPPR